MEILRFHKRGGRGRSHIVLMMVAGFAFCAPFASTQSTATYAYAGKTFTYDPFDVLLGYPFLFEPSSVSATLTFYNLTPGYTGWAYPSFATVSSLGFTCFLSNPAHGFSNNEAAVEFTTGVVTAWTVNAECVPVLPSLTYLNVGTGSSLTSDTPPIYDYAWYCESIPSVCNAGAEAVGPGTWSPVSIQAGTTPPLQITAPSLPNASSGQPYPPATTTATITAMGGSGSDYVWCVQSGSSCVLSGSPLPEGFTLSAEVSCGSACSEVALSSTGAPPAPVGSYPFTVQVTDSAGNLQTQQLTIVVQCTGLFVLTPGQGLGVTFTPVPPPIPPPGGFTLGTAAANCGFTQFDWQQTMTQWPSPSTLKYMSDGTPVAIPPQGPTYDPPPDGYTDSASQVPPFVGAYPFLYNPADVQTGCAAMAVQNGPCIQTITQGNTLHFHDAPNSRCLPGGTLFGSGACQGDPNGESSMAFTTQLVGLCSTPSPACTLSVSGTSWTWAVLHQWTWHSNYNGTTGGTSLDQTANSYLPDPGSGTGGVTITSIDSVQLPTAVSPSQVATTASGLAYSRVSQTFNGTVTISNVSASAISGPLQIVFFGMPAGVTLANATSNLSGTQYMTVPAVAGLAPGQLITVSVQFKNPSNTTLNLTPVVYSGSIN